MKTYLFIFALIVHGSVFASGAHDAHHDDDAHEEMAEGPHGGRLLEGDDVKLEITIFESGIPAEMRIYSYKANGTAIAADDIMVTVTLDRTGGQKDRIHFSSENDYLVSDTVIDEPHSFKVAVTAEYRNKDYHWHFDSFEGRAEISDRLLSLSKVETEQAGPQTLSISNTVYGVISKVEDQVFHIHAPYPGIIEAMYVQTGDTVKKGQVLLSVRNQQTLKRYDIRSPSAGEVTLRPAKRGDHSNMGTLVEISDLSSAWVEMSMFPKDIELIKKGMKVTVHDLHDKHSAIGELDYLSPQMTGGHIARARATISNTEGVWRPGMHVKAEVMIERITVPLAVKRSALQSFRGMPVVFGRFGNVFEVRMLELGRQDNEYIEVLNGLKAGTEYVINNSYLLKAEVLKSGASHDH